MVRVTVFHDGRFWVLLGEREEAGFLRAVRRLCAEEPGEPEVRGFATWAIREGLDSCPPVEAPDRPLVGGFKRRLREARAERSTLGGRSQAALQAQRELSLLHRREERSRGAEEERQRHFRDRRRRSKRRHDGKA